MAVSKPKTAEGNYKRRGEIFAVITHFTGQNKWNEFSIIAVIIIKLIVILKTIGDSKFQLFTSGSTGLIQMMKK